MLSARAGVLPIVAHQSAQLADAEPGFLVHADQEGWRHRYPTLSDLANLRRRDLQAMGELSIVWCSQNTHQRVQEGLGVIVRIMFLNGLEITLVHTSPDSVWSGSRGAAAPLRTVS